MQELYSKLYVTRWCQEDLSRCAESHHTGHQVKRLIDINSILRRCILVVHSRETFLPKFKKCLNNLKESYHLQMYSSSSGPSFLPQIVRNSVLKYFFCNASKAPAHKWKFLHGGIIPPVLDYQKQRYKARKHNNEQRILERSWRPNYFVTAHRIPVWISVQPMNSAVKGSVLGWLSRHFRLQIISSCYKIVSNYKLLGSKQWSLR